MTESNTSMRRLHLTVATLTVFGAFTLAACGSDSPKSSDTTTPSTAAPEDIIVPDSVVTAGLQKLPATIAAAITAIGTPDAKAKLDQIEAEWFSFEGTVRDNDTTLYLAIEDQLTPLQRQIEQGDSATAATTAATLQGLFDEYLAKYPG